MVIAILMESDVKLSDDLLEAIIDKVVNNQLECRQGRGVGVWGGLCVCVYYGDFVFTQFPRHLKTLMQIRMEK